MTEHTRVDPATYCLSHLAVEEKIKALIDKQKHTETKIEGIQDSIVKLRVSHARVVGIGTAILGIFQLVLKYLL